MPRRANPRPTRRGAGKLDLYSNWLKTLKNASKTTQVALSSSTINKSGLLLDFMT